MDEFPSVVELLYNTWVGDPRPSRWPSWLREYPVDGHGMFSFYQGLLLGFRLYAACGEEELSPAMQCHHRDFRTVPETEGPAGVAQSPGHE